jgi:hypothetical protein
MVELVEQELVNDLLVTALPSTQDGQHIKIENLSP